MKKECVFKANSIEQAKEMAVQKFGRKIDEIQFIVQKDVKKGLFGKIKEQAEVRAIYQDIEAFTESNIKQDKEQNEKSQNKKEQQYIEKQSIEKSIPEDRKKEKKKSDVSPIVQKKADKGLRFLNDILNAIGCKELNKEMKIDKNVVIIKIIGDDLGCIIGRKGETLSAIQYLTTLIANRGGSEYVRFIIDCGNYREKKVSYLKEMADTVAHECIKENKAFLLEPMNSYERRIIHTAVSEMEEIYTKSVGEEPNRRIMISSKNAPKENLENVQVWRRHHNQKYDSNYLLKKGASNQPSTYDFEKEFLKEEREDNKLYGKIDLN